MAQPEGSAPPPRLGTLLLPYRGLVIGLALLTIAGNALTLVVPRLVASAIDGHEAGTFDPRTGLWTLLAVSIGIAVFAYLQGAVQTIAAERVSRDLRTRLMATVSQQSQAFVQRVTPAALLTHLTSDVDAVKVFVSQAVASLIASAFLIVGASVQLLSINAPLGAAVLATVPVMGGSFFLVLRQVRAIFLKAQEAIDRLNRVINESIIGAALVRVLHVQDAERAKFARANAEARDLSLRILKLFAGVFPVMVFATNAATLIILLMGGRFVMRGSMTLGELTAFYSYLSILVFPVVMIGFMSNVVAQAGASYTRLAPVLDAPLPPASGHVETPLRGAIAVEHVSLSLDGRAVLKDVSFHVAAGSRAAIIGPTGAGKTQLLYVLARLLPPDAGTIRLDGTDLQAFDDEALHRQVGLVFQDSVVFNLTLRENIAFSRAVSDADLERAVRTAELQEFVAQLPDGLDTMISERGTSLSGGQKQRIMLARALALDPRILLLDDFTARVDLATARQILDNVHREYPGVTLVVVTQQIAPVAGYEHVVLLMEGEVLASGTHQTLLETSPEYAQIHESQRSTSHYELLRS